LFASVVITPAPNLSRFRTDVLQNLDNLIGGFGHGQCRRVNLFEGVVEFWGVQRNECFAFGRRIAGVESRVSLAVLFPKLDHNNV
jgi:hypothetical protein